MKHFVHRKVLFTIGKDYDGNTETLKMNYVNCQWQNAQNEVCEVDILVYYDEVEKALEGDYMTRENIFTNFAHYLMLSFNPSIIS